MNLKRRGKKDSGEAPMQDDGDVAVADDNDSDEEYATIVQVEKGEDIASICGHVDGAPTFAVIVNAPRGNADLASELGGRRLVRHAEESGKVVAIATHNRAVASRARQLRIPVARSPERVRWDAGGRRVIGSFALPAIGRFVQLTVILAVAVVAVILALTMAPGATVNAYPPTETLSRTVIVTASRDLQTPDYANLKVPAHQVSTTEHLTIPVAVTGTAPVGTAAATASIVIHNPGTSSVTVPKGTALTALNNSEMFTIDADTVVPAGGNAAAHVTAIQRGVAGNIGAGGLGRWVDDKLSKLTITNSAPAGGGTDTNRPAVAQADLDRAKQLAESLASADSVKQLLAHDRPHDAVFLETATATASMGKLPAAGTPTDIMLVDVEVKVSALAVLEQDLNALVERNLTPQAGAGQFVPGTVGASEAAPATVNGGVVTALLELHGEFARNVSADAIRDAVKGKSKSDAQSTLAERYGIQKADVNLTPGWAPWIPRFGFRINVNLRTAQPTATPKDGGTNGASPTVSATAAGSPNPGT